MLLLPETQEQRLSRYAAAAEREVRMRRSVYPRWVDAGKMKREKADAEIAVMEEIAAYFHDAARAASS